MIKRQCRRLNVINSHQDGKKITQNFIVLKIPRLLKIYIISIFNPHNNQDLTRKLTHHGNNLNINKTYIIIESKENPRTGRRDY